MESFPFAKRRGDEGVQKKKGRKENVRQGETGKPHQRSRVDWAFSEALQHCIRGFLITRCDLQYIFTCKAYRVVY